VYSGFDGRGTYGRSDQMHGSQVRGIGNRLGDKMGRKFGWSVTSRRKNDSGLDSMSHVDIWLMVCPGFQKKHDSRVYEGNQRVSYPFPFGVAFVVMGKTRYFSLNPAAPGAWEKGGGGSWKGIQPVISALTPSKLLFSCLKLGKNERSKINHLFSSDQD
jgi:hypothetical protein